MYTQGVYLEEIGTEYVSKLAQSGLEMDYCMKYVSVDANRSGVFG